MRKRITFLLVLFFSTGAYAQTNWFKGSLDDAKTLAAKENKQIMLHFAATGG